jgi:NADPH:quinone reductase
MKALAYKKAHSLKEFVIKSYDVATPELRPNDVLVKIHAISVNPVDFKIRGSRSGTDANPVILGWDASGVIEKLGSDVKNFSIGDEVYYAGDLMRAGSYAELQAVDSRIIALKPKTLSHVEAVSLPLTSLTAWEALLERGFVYSQKTKILIIGGAGGVGSIATQLLKAKTPATVIATASRPETMEWAKKMGADHIIDHRKPLGEELKKLGIDALDIIFSTTHTENYLSIIPKLLRPFGSLCLIDDPKTLDITQFKVKALSVHWEFMFAKTMNDYHIETQGKILTEIAKLVDNKKIKHTAGLVLEGLNPENIHQAHKTLESNGSIGKIIIKII